MTWSYAIGDLLEGGAPVGESTQRPSPPGGTVESMAATAARGEVALAAEEAQLARAAAAGDGAAFAELYQRYARRAYNLALRISGSDEDAADAVQEAFVSVLHRLPELGDRELAFGSYLFTATRNATYDLLRRQQRTRPSDSIPESAVPVGAGAGGLGLDPGDPEEDPDRRLLLASQQEEIREANNRLPERQREALALRELEDLSYDEIAELMEMNRNSVAQLISRARINLRVELRGGALASVIAASPECERALPLIAMRDDGQLDDASADAAWLEGHLQGCERCLVATEAMQEAGVSYRAWVPVAIAPWLFKATMAKAAALSGADWSEETAAHLAAPAAGLPPGTPPTYRGSRASSSRPRRRAVLAAAAAALVLGLVAAAVFADGDDGAAPPPTERRLEAPAAEDEVAKREPARQRADVRPKKAARDKEAAKDTRRAVPVEETIDSPAPQQIPSDVDPSPPQRADNSGSAELGTQKPASEQPSKSSPSEPAPESKPAPSPQTPTQTEEPTAPPVVEEPTEEPPAEPPAEEPKEERPERPPGQPPAGGPPTP
jgi:RNA polymerase sigma factor (sigma-70 family)